MKKSVSYITSLVGKNVKIKHIRCSKHSSSFIDDCKKLIFILEKATIISKTLITVILTNPLISNTVRSWRLKIYLDNYNEIVEDTFQIFGVNSKFITI